MKEEEGWKEEEDWGVEVQAAPTRALLHERAGTRAQALHGYVRKEDSQQSRKATGDEADTSGEVADMKQEVVEDETNVGQGVVGRQERHVEGSARVDDEKARSA